jgi:transcriptional regulator GlxA family with amidase domain
MARFLAELAQYLEVIRLERARQALEHGTSVTRAAELAGFRSGVQMRRAWSRQRGGSPRDVLQADRRRPRHPLASRS